VSFFLFGLRVCEVITMADPKTSVVAIAALTKQFRELGEVLAPATGHALGGPLW
jgi:hypothetical protein